MVLHFSCLYVLYDLPRRWIISSLHWIDSPHRWIITSTRFIVGSTHLIVGSSLRWIDFASSLDHLFVLVMSSLSVLYFSFSFFSFFYFFVCVKIFISFFISTGFNLEVLTVIGLMFFLDCSLMFLTALL